MLSESVRTFPEGMSQPLLHPLVEAASGVACVISLHAVLLTSLTRPADTI